LRFSDELCLIELNGTGKTAIKKICSSDESAMRKVRTFREPSTYERSAPGKHRPENCIFVEPYPGEVGLLREDGAKEASLLTEDSICKPALSGETTTRIIRSWEHESRKIRNFFSSFALDAFELLLKFPGALAWIAGVHEAGRLPFDIVALIEDGSSAMLLFKHTADDVAHQMLA
jgi:hypothetical protein